MFMIMIHFNLQESLKFDEVVYNGYKVLKEVKRHKNMAETNWDLAMLEFDERYVSCNIQHCIINYTCMCEESQSMEVL